MEYTELGKGGIRVSRLCLGTMTFGWTADEAASFAILDAFIEAGGTFLDTADLYSRWAPGNHGGESERMIGKWLAARGLRDRVVIATKARGRMWPGPAGEGLSREHLVKACEQSLKRMGIETIDLYQCHWPDEDTPIEASLRAMEELQKAGKVRCAGVSNYTAAQLQEAIGVATAAGLPGFVSLQPHYNLVHRREYEAELEAVCLANGIAVIPYSPLAKGFLTGRYAKGVRAEGTRSRQARGYGNELTWAVLEEVQRVARERGAAPASVALAWLLQRPGVAAPIVGASRVEQLADQLAGVSLRLTAGEVSRLDAVSAGL